MYIPRKTASQFVEILNLDLPPRAENVLLREGIHRITDLTAMTENEIAALDGIGKKSVADIKERLRANGLELFDPVCKWKPIETAPKDGRQIFVWRVPLPWLGEVIDNRIVIACWHREKECWTMGTINGMPIEATHWVSIPELPEAPANAGD